MSIVNLIYLGLLTNRVPVIPPHVPMHVGVEANDFEFGKIFDIPKLRTLLGHPVIEWRDVKNGIELDHIGCWTVWATAEGKPDGEPRGSRLQYSLHLGEWPTLRILLVGGVLILIRRHFVHHRTR